MIIWLNGPFGAGKTTVAAEIAVVHDEFIVFDTEQLGYAIRPTLSPRVPVNDFQDWRTWRRLVVTALSGLADEANAHLVVPQAVLVESYWREIQEGLAGDGHRVLAFTLDVSEAEHTRRVDADVVETSAREWRHERWADYLDACDWLAQETRVLDTTLVTPRVVADWVLEALRDEV